MKPIRLTYLLHRWIGTCLGALVFIWFASGIVMLYYPYPSISDARTFGALRPFEPDTTLIGFHRGWTIARAAPGNDHTELVSGRLERLGNTLVYQFLRDQGDVPAPAVLIDARTGAVLSPVTPALAESAARAMVPVGGAPAVTDLLRYPDHYMLDIAYAARFPAYRVRFADPHQTAVYVGVRGGDPFGVVTRLTRFTTWTGTVPHWFYFIWLYDRPGLWDAAFLTTGSLIILLAIAGIIWGSVQLVKRRRRATPALSPYRGMSRWHHLSGIFFGGLVLTWTASGLYQNFGAGNLPRAGQAARIRHGPTAWSGLALSESDALHRLRRTDSSLGSPVAVELIQFDGRPGYVFHFPGSPTRWVNAATGRVRRDLADPELRHAAGLVMGRAIPLTAIEKISAYDHYYYARHGRTLPLPAWRLTFNNPAPTRLYLDPVTGAPTGFVDAASIRARWLRDGIHSLDFPGLNNHRPLWDLVILPLLLAGLVISGTGVSLAVRRLRNWRN